MLNSHWDGRPEEYARERDCWLNRRRELYVEGFLSRLPRGASVLEIGSGTGGLLIGLARRRPDLSFLGIEPQRVYVVFAREEAARAGVTNVRFESGTMEELGTAAGGFRPDCVLTNDVLHHVNDWDRGVLAVGAVAQAQCWWLAIEPNSWNPYVLLGQTFKAGERNFRPGAFARLAASRGWKRESSRYLFLIPPFVKRPHPALLKLEAALEGIPAIAGGVALAFSRTPS